MQGAEEGDSEREEEPEFDKMAEVRDAEGGRQRAHEHTNPRFVCSRRVTCYRSNIITRAITQSSIGVSIVLRNNATKMNTDQKPVTITWTLTSLTLLGHRRKPHCDNWLGMTGLE